jgi:hypothetical protein
VGTAAGDLRLVALNKDLGERAATVNLEVAGAFGGLEGVASELRAGRLTDTSGATFAGRTAEEFLWGRTAAGAAEPAGEVRTPFAKCRMTGAVAGPGSVKSVASWLPVGPLRSCRGSPAWRMMRPGWRLGARQRGRAVFRTETNTIRLVLSGMQNRTPCPSLVARHM